MPSMTAITHEAWLRQPTTLVKPIAPSGQLWHTIRNADGSWQPQFGLVEGQETNNPDPFVRVGCAGVGNIMELVGIVNGQLWHTIRNADGSWQSQFGLVEGPGEEQPGRLFGHQLCRRGQHNGARRHRQRPVVAHHP